MSQPVHQPQTTSPANDAPQILDPAQVSNLLKIFKNGQVDLGPDAAQSLQALAQGLFPIPVPTPFPGPSMPGMGDPGPSSHPRGPPNLGQLSAVAAAAVQSPPIPPGPPIQEAEEANKDGDDSDKPKGQSATGRSRGNRPAAMGTDEWARQRKDNHKEVERRRRGNINEGINELGRIVPNSSGEKAKGAILARAVQYIHHLKENEARNIEKWTLEKLLMDQAMGDLQAQLDEVRRLWEEDRVARQRAETELEVLRQHGVGAQPRPPSQHEHATYKSRSQSVEQQEGRGAFSEGEARPEEDANTEQVDGRPGKRPRVD